MKHARWDERSGGFSFDTCTARESGDSGPSASFTLEKVHERLQFISANKITKGRGFLAPGSRCSVPAVSDGVCPGGGTTAPAGRSADTGEDPFLLKRDHQNVARRQEEACR